MLRWQTCGLQTVFSRAALTHTTLVICLFKLWEQFFKPCIFETNWGRGWGWGQQTFCKKQGKTAFNFNFCLYEMGGFKVYHNVRLFVPRRNMLRMACDAWRSKKTNIQGGSTVQQASSVGRNLGSGSSSRELSLRFILFWCSLLPGRTGLRTCSSCTAVLVGRSGVALNFITIIIFII